MREVKFGTFLPTHDFGKAQAAADYLRGLALRDQQPSMAA